ncbi:MAG: endolytic transglycosylase MltG [Gammaproteobacteria bacterium]|nr:endolytic transglycosylase MltG [Gammaproteobacteria bacterium]
MWWSRVLGIILLIGSFGSGWILLDYRSFLATPLLEPPQPAVMFQVRPGSSLNGFAHDLARQGLIEHPRFLVWHARLSGDAQHLKAGEYRIEPGMTPRQLLQQVIAGNIVQYPLAIIEGWTLQQVLAELHSKDWINKTLVGLSPAEIGRRLGIKVSHPEGLLQPDTYYLTRGTTDLDVLQRAYRAQQQYLEATWTERAPDLPYRTAYEALIMASIVEKETGVAEERPEIAGVFIRRLQKKMLLQTDPTVIYGLGKGFDGNLRRRDLQADTPYNTYTRSGLPPTPIAIPSKDAIVAALHPAPGNSLYFVARGDGTHQFSATLQAHLQAVRKYQLKRKKG